MGWGMDRGGNFYKNFVQKEDLMNVCAMLAQLIRSLTAI